MAITFPWCSRISSCSMRPASRTTLSQVTAAQHNSLPWCVFPALPCPAVLLPYGQRGRLWEALAAALLTSTVSFLVPMMVACQVRAVCSMPKWQGVLMLCQLVLGPSQHTCRRPSLSMHCLCSPHAAIPWFDLCWSMRHTVHALTAAYSAALPCGTHAYLSRSRRSSVRLAVANFPVLLLPHAPLPVAQQPCPPGVTEACPRMDNAHSGNFVNFACPAGNQYHDLATIFFNTQARWGGGNRRLVTRLLWAVRV